MIDLGRGVVPSRRAIPRVSSSSIGRGRSSASTQSLSQRVRSTSTASELDQARRRLSASRTKGATSSSRPGAPSKDTRTISPKDVADRYSSVSKGRPAAPSRSVSGRPVRSVSDRSASDRSVADRISSARSDKAASNASRIADMRRSAAARSASARTTAARVKNARADESRSVRIRNARVKSAAQDEKTRSNNARIDTARQDFANRVAAARRKGAGAPGVSVKGRSLSGGRSPIQAIGAKGRGQYGAGYGFNGYRPDPYYNRSFWNHWGGRYSNGWCSWFWSPFYLTGLVWQNHSYYGGGYSNGYNGRFNNTIWLGPFLPSTSSVIVYDDPEPEIIYVEVPAEQEAIDESVEGASVEGEALVEAAPPQAFPRESTDPGLQRELNRAAAYYLTQGDRAFREARFGDAAHFYAKAVEFSSDSGILYLVLSDALFATGDYRYAAYALRQAFDREPSLASNLVDKRDFYSEPALFDSQLSTLESYVEDHVLDMDARLVLSANYLFAGRPDLCLSLLENPFSEELRGTAEGLLLQQSAGSIMFGEDSGGALSDPAAGSPATGATENGREN